MLAVRSGQALLRHTGVPAESCFLPDLTRFTGSRCAGPDPRHFLRVVPDGSPSLEREFSPPYVGLGYRAPRAPRLARRFAGYPLPPRSPVRSTAPEGCESGRIGTLGKRVWGNSPWVRIPLPPPWAVSPGQSGSFAGSPEWRDTHVTQRSAGATLLGHAPDTAAGSRGPGDASRYDTPQRSMLLCLSVRCSWWHRAPQGIRCYPASVGVGTPAGTVIIGVGGRSAPGRSPPLPEACRR